MLPLFELDGKRVVIVNGRGRRGSIRIATGEEIVVSKPRWLSSARAFEELQKTWPRIRRRLERVPSNLIVTPKTFTSGELLACFGETFELLVSSETERLFVRGQTLHVPQGSAEDRREALRAWIRERMADETETLVAEYARLLGASWSKIRIGDFRSQLGSCVRQSVLKFHWGIALLPRDHFEAVVAHEAAHLVNSGHDRAFWQTVESLKPGARVLHRAFRPLGPRLRF